MKKRGLTIDGKIKILEKEFNEACLKYFFSESRQILEFEFVIDTEAFIITL